MNLLKISFILLVFLVSCKSRNVSSSKSQSDSTGTAFAVIQIQKADSAWNTRYGSSFVGIHSHGKDLAVHAHQDLGKQRRVLKESVLLLPKLTKNYEHQLEERKRILEEKGLYTPSSADSTTK